MSWHGKQGKGAMRTRREVKRAEAEQRQARAEARKVVEAYAAEREGGAS